MGIILYVYNINNLKAMRDIKKDYHFCSIASLIHIYNSVDELKEIEASKIENSIIDITNLIKDGTYYRIFTERYLWTLVNDFKNVYLSLQDSFLEIFKEIYPYFIDEDNINYEFQYVYNKNVVSSKKIIIQQPLVLFVYKNQASMKKLYKAGSAISLSNLIDECDSLGYKYNLMHINSLIIEENIKYIDITSIVKALKIRRDLTFQFEILVHNISSSNNIKYCIDSRFSNETIEAFPLVFFTEQNIDDCDEEIEIVEKKQHIVDMDKIKSSVEKINEKLRGHIVFKNDFHHNLLKFSFLNKMNERKILSILLCGESGIGKTEFAKIASNIMYPNDPLIKINFGNYSTEGVLNSLVGSPLGYIGSEEGGELINKIVISKSKIILIDEFEKATPSVYNFFYELLEDGKFTDRHGLEHELNGYIIIFTSNMTEKQYIKHIPNSLKSRFDMVYNFEDLPEDEKREFILSTTSKLIEKLNEEFNIPLDKGIVTYELNGLIKYKNLRDMKRKIEDIVFSEFFKHYKN